MLRCARSALVLVMHASENPQGNFLQKLIAKEAIKALSAQDYCGVMDWNGNENWIYGPGPVDMGHYRNKLLAAVDRMSPGDMPDFEPSMLLAEQGFIGLQNQQVAVKHMIVISDGDPGPPSNATIGRLRAMGVTISAVAIDAHGTAEKREHGEHGLAGRRQVLRGQAVAKRQGTAADFSERGPPRLPPAALPGRTRHRREGENDPRDARRHRLAAADYGLRAHEQERQSAGGNRAVGQQTQRRRQYYSPSRLELRPGPRRGLHQRRRHAWTKDWTGRAVYDKFFGQIIRWSMRPSGGSGKFTTTFEPHEGRIQVVVNALDNNDEFLNFLTMTGTAVGPDLKKPHPAGDRAIAHGPLRRQFRRPRCPAATS